MQTVSENWKSAHKQTLLNESYVEVSLDVADPDALAAVSSRNDGAVDNGAVYISDTLTVVSEVKNNARPYCTLEQNLWVLNGERKAIPVSDYGGSGYVGDVLSNDVCVFEDKVPVITLNFGTIFTNPVPGITITWSPTYGEFADSFVITAYNGNTVVATKEVNGNRSVKSLVMMNIVNYDRITIAVTKWCLPHHRARVEEIFVGVNKVYSKTALFSYSHSQSVSPVSTALPKNEISFSVDNVDGEYNPYNEQGLAKYLMDRQEVKARYGLKLNDGTVEWIKGGTFYLAEWYAKQNGLTAEFTARDLLEFMSDICEDGEHDLSSRSLYSLAEKVLTAANLPLNSDGSVKWIIDESLREIPTTAPLPADTLANCLQLIANAGMCVLYQDRDGILHIEPLKSDVTDYKIDSFNSYSKSEVTLGKPIKYVEMTVYFYTMGDKGIESTTGVAGVDMSELVASGERIVVDNPLITDPMYARQVGEWMARQLSYRMTLESSWRGDVRLDALDIVKNENNYNTQNVRMTDVKFTYKGAFRATGEGKEI